MSKCVKCQGRGWYLERFSDSHRTSCDCRQQKRETDGRYAFDGNLQRFCVCGHSLGVHSAGSPADCLLYSFSDSDPQRLTETAPDDCGCKQFRLAREKATYTILGGGINHSGWWVYTLINNQTGKTVEKSRKAVAQLRQQNRITESIVTNKV